MFGKRVLFSFPLGGDGSLNESDSEITFMTGEVVGEGPMSTDIDTDEVLFSSDFRQIPTVRRTDDDSGIDRISIVLGYEDEEGNPMQPTRHYASYDEFMLPIVRIPKDWIVTEVAHGVDPLRDLARRLWWNLEIFEVPVVKPARIREPARGRGRQQKQKPTSSKSDSKEPTIYWYRNQPNPRTGLSHWEPGKSSKGAPSGGIETPYQLGSANKVYLEWELPADPAQKRPRPIVKSDFWDFTPNQQQEVQPVLRALAPVARGKEVKHPERKIFWGTNKMFDMTDGEYWPNNYPSDTRVQAGDLLAGFRYAHPKPGSDDKIGMIFRVTPKFFKLVEYVFDGWNFPDIQQHPLFRAIEFQERYDDELDEMALTYQRAILMVREILSDPDLSEEATDTFEDVLNVLLTPPPVPQKTESK